jgi:hypothetical protein
LNQQQFWSKIGVTQSGGSRYESGRNMPKPVRELLRLVHVEQIDIQRLKREDFEVLEYVKAEDPELFKTLKKAAKKQAQEACLSVRCVRRPRGFAVRRQSLTRTTECPWPGMLKVIRNWRAATALTSVATFTTDSAFPWHAGG